MRPSLFYASDFTITRDWYSTLREIALVFQFHACRLYLLSVYIDGGCFYSLDALYFPVHLYPLRFRRSILTALMRPSLFLCVWLHHYERLIFHITRDCYSTLREIDIPHYERLHSNIMRDWYSPLREIALVFQFHACRLYLLSVDIDGGYSVLSTHSTSRPSLPSTLSPVYSYGDYATFPLPLLPYIY